MARLLLRLCFCLGALVISACEQGQQGVKPCHVEGVVRLDGAPMAEGKIYFQSRGKPGKVMSIQDGSFKGEIKQGMYRVEIRAFRPSVVPPSRKDNPPPGMGESNYLPSRFNTNSTLTAEVSCDGDPLVFAVESK